MSAFLSDPVFILVVSLIVVVGSIVWLRVGAFFALLSGALVVKGWDSLSSDSSLTVETIIKPVCEALGTTAGNIGLLIVLGTTIGKCMAENGSAERIVVACRRFFGEKRIPTALSGGAFLLSIPVFYDATFYLLLPLAKSAYRVVRRNYAQFLLSVGLAATISHTVIPPTPGPIAVAQTLGVPLSTALGVSLIVGVCLFPIALTLSWALDKLLPNPNIDPVVLEELSLARSTDVTVSSDSVPKRLPPLLVALAPILTPAILIGSASILRGILTSSGKEVGETGILTQCLFFLGDVNVALGVAALFACLSTLFSRYERGGRSELERKLVASVTMAGTIILITSAGGAYGAMLRDSGIGERIKELFECFGGISGAWALTLAFLSTALLKSAQGSSTTAMITSASIFASMNLSGETLGFNPAYLGASIGVGSSVASWMNDSGFCVFAKSSGLREVDCLKVWTVGTGLLGFGGYLVVLVLSRIFPMV